MKVISLFLAVCLTVSSAVIGAVEGQPSGKAMTLKGAETLCNLSYALRVVSAEIQKKHQNATGMVDKFREWRHRHGVKGRTWKAIVQGLEKIGVVNGSEMENIKKTYVEMEKVMNNMDDALQVMDASFLDIVRVSYHVVNASLSIGQVLRDLVVLFEKTKEDNKYCCLVKEKAASAGGGNGCGSGGGGNCKYEAADAPNKCNMSFTEDVSDDGVLSVLNKYTADQEVELTVNASPNCWIMGTEEVADGGPGSFIVGTTGGFVTYKKGSAVTLMSSVMVTEIIKNYTLVRKGFESIKDKYNELKPKFGPFDEYENKLKELLTQSPMVRRYFKESGKKRKGGEDDDDVIDEEGFIMRKQHTLVSLIFFAGMLIM
ncbi:expression site-associated gene 11 (ESAG11) protein, putative [Trypanosoma brucei gambiense DAL972]|uniref:Expression site-associated gene 11 (ESAG11) protein, putative n=1 Tax=Trypanosoma brucei gambiense (strain MHOM/CI/86/DAL972) TaxID=679716 RepID=C9ZY27_TRYB9|nr:expression site-associated gene 11 (ESAG11) protein, putative [Trypanosoma brucei gambiense DAL972]CBH14325.1 expression site-associated gene 11 (ESAG11) protein, putative [Trypanosoma brucei gambiense DAL972]|eukprot:XP_011776592.1 expression site-associated gene 11 (ESAG11) protein, putative [Trypanosoma brucei gambiense DAL972]